VREISYSHSGLAEDSGLLVYYTVSIDK